MPQRDVNAVPAPSCITVVVPCLNEEKNISTCLLSLQPFGFGEIVVVDSGSTDRTRGRVRNYHPEVTLHCLQSCNLAEIRNFGAERAKHDFILFLDADTVLAKTWSAQLEHLTRSQNSRYGLKRAIIGSMVMPPAHAGWVGRIWSEMLIRKRERNPRFVNAAHMLISRSLLTEIGGFDTRYPTGEEIDLCRRVRQAGGEIIVNQGLEAIHHGDPVCLTQFYRRERWHLLGKVLNFRQNAFEKDVLFGLWTTALLFVAASSVAWMLVAGTSSAIFVLGLQIAAATVVPTTMSAARAKSPRTFLPLAFLVFVYGCAKSAAIVEFVYRGSRSEISHWKKSRT